MTKKQRNTVVAGAMVLAISNLLVKAIGLLFKIPLSAIISDEGMGYFNAAYTIYSWFYVVSTAGLPVAISLMISESKAKGQLRQTRRIFRVTLLMMFCIGLVGSSIMMFGSKGLAGLIESTETYRAIRAIAPTLFFICIASAFRGYFQGNQNMVPTAVSQLIEAVGKLALGLIFASYALKQGYGLPTVAAYAVLGPTVGTGVGMIYLFVTKLLSGRRNDASAVQELPDEPLQSRGKIATALIAIAIPITLSASVMSVTNLIDVMLIIRRLKDIGFEEAVATAIYGNYTTLAVPMYNLPTALIYPISYSITPLISAHRSKGEEEAAKTVIHSALKVSAIITVPASLGMAAFSEPILKLFFAPAKAEMAAPLLSVLAMSIFLVGMLTVINAVLQAYKFERKPILAMAIGAAVKVVASYILIGIPQIGMYGTPIGTFLCFLTITAIDLWFLARYVGVRPNLGKILVRPFASAVPAVGGAMLLYRFTVGKLYNTKAAVLSMLLAVVLYFVLLLIMKGVTKEEIVLLPGGKKLYGLLNKLKFM